jgi:SRSO17 transposase
MPVDIVLADASYSHDSKFHNGLEALGLQYVLGVQCTTTVEPEGSEPLQPPRYRGRGRRSMLRTVMVPVSRRRCGNWPSNLPPRAIAP